MSKLLKRANRFGRTEFDVNLYMVKLNETCFLQYQGGKGYWAVNYTGTQSLLTTILVC